MLKQEPVKVALLSGEISSDGEMQAEDLAIGERKMGLFSKKNRSNLVAEKVDHIVDTIRRGDCPNTPNVKEYAAEKIVAINMAYEQSGRTDLALECLDVLSEELGIVPMKDDDPISDGYLNRLIDALENANSPDLDRRQWYAERARTRTVAEFERWRSNQDN